MHHAKFFLIIIVFCLMLLIEVLIAKKQKRPALYFFKSLLGWLVAIISIKSGTSVNTDYNYRLTEEDQKVSKKFQKAIFWIFMGGVIIAICLYVWIYVINNTKLLG